MPDVTVWKNGDGMTRVTPNSSYPHYTEQWRVGADGNFEKTHFDNNPMWDAHYSPGPTDPRYGVHHNRGAILGDLGIAPPWEFPG